MSKIRGLLQLLRCPPCLFSFISCLVAFKITNEISVDALLFLIGIFTAQNLVGHALNDLCDKRIDDLCFRKKGKWSGGSKVLQYGLLSKDELKTIILFCCCLGLILSIYLIIKYGFPMFLLISLGFLLLFFHNILFQKTLIGEATGTFSYFILPGIITYFILSRTIELHFIFLIMFLFGYFSLTLHHLNDIEEDKAFGKRTVAVALGRKKTKKLLWISLILSYLSILIYSLMKPTALFALITSLILIPLLKDLDVMNDESIDNASKKDLYPILLTILFVIFL